MAFSSEVARVRDIPVLRLVGDIDIAAEQALQSTIAELAADSDLIVVDLSAVEFFDSSGLKLLDDAQRAARAHGARLALASPPGRVLRLFEIAGMDDDFDIRPDAEQAATDDRG